MVNDWNGCRKEECKLWEVAGVASCCKLHGRYEDKCENTGEFFMPKKVEPVVEYEGVKAFTALDLATAGIDLEKHGFIKRKVPGFKFSDLVTWEHSPGQTWLGVIRKSPGQEISVFCISPECFGVYMDIDKSRLTLIKIP